MAEITITERLWDLGVTHKRDEWSHTDSCHALYYAGRMIGRYSAFQVSKLLEEHGLSGSSDVLHEEGRPMCEARPERASDNDQTRL